MNERCENCGRFVTDQQLWHSEVHGHSVCDYCYTPSDWPRDDHYLNQFDPHATLHDITNS